jgi:sugar phosphate isomerase/epimerase
MQDLAIGICCGTLIDCALPELIETAARHGFPSVTARPASFAEAIERGWSEPRLRRLLADAGVRVSMVDALTKGLPGLPGPETLDAAWRALLPPDAIDPPDEAVVLRAAEALEAPWVNVAHFRGRPVPLAEMAEAIGGVCRRAAARGLGVALEFVPGTGLPDLAFALAVAEACGEPNCRITLDPWHFDRSGGGVEDLRRLPPGALAGVQLCDRTRPPPGTPYLPMSGRDLPGEGQLPLGDLVRAAVGNSPGLGVEVEVFSQELRGLSPDAIAARVAQAVNAWRAGLGQAASRPD